MSLYDLTLDLVGHDVVEVFGESGSGKTSFALLLISDALKKGLNVVYIDTEMNLDEKRVEALKDKGLKYYYMTDVDEIINYLKNEPSFDVLVLDSLGMPVLRKFALASMKEKGDMLLKVIAISGLLKSLSKKNHALVLVTNQPESEFGKTIASQDDLWPFGDKHVFDIKEIWRSAVVVRGKSSTVTKIYAWRSRKFPHGTDLLQLAIGSWGIKAKVLVKPEGTENPAESEESQSEE